LPLNGRIYPFAHGFLGFHGGWLGCGSQ